MLVDGEYLLSEDSSLVGWCLLKLSGPGESVGDAEEIESRVWQMLVEERDPQVLENVCTALELTVSPANIGKRNALYKFLLKYLNSDTVLNSEDEGLSAYLKIDEVLSSTVENPPLIVRNVVQRNGVTGTPSVSRGRGRGRPVSSTTHGRGRGMSPTGSPGVTAASLGIKSVKVERSPCASEIKKVNDAVYEISSYNININIFVQYQYQYQYLRTL